MSVIAIVRSGRLSALCLIATAIGCTIASGVETTMSAPGLKEPAEILVDTWGVPHIYAKNFDDAFFVQGFNAARDRLFQIDLWRRRGLGQLAEVLGTAYSEQDRASRLFLYRGDMEKEWTAYGPDAKRMATAFVAGVNAYVGWLAANPDRMPLEFKLLGYLPSKWSPQDVVRIRTHGVARNLASEVARSNVVCKTDPRDGPKYDQVRLRLEPPWNTKVPEGLDPCLPADVLKVFGLATSNVPFSSEIIRPDGLPSIRAASADLDATTANGDGSNNWTIARSKSATGRAILANDPHRAYSTPSLRYIAHVTAPGMNIVGAGEPFLPGISIGHNDVVAFGVTSFLIDQEDLYVYELNPANAREYRYRQAWEPMRVVRETIRVKDAVPVEVELLFTRHGPVIYSQPGVRRAFAVRSCWLEPGTAPYLGSARYASSTNFREFQRGVSRAPGLNYVYADVKGNIGWVPAGIAPVRPNWDGLMPVPGDGRYEWAGFWSSSKLPVAYNPPSGYLSTSNEMNLPANYPYRERKLSFEWVNPSRHARIEEVLNPLKKVSIEDSMRLQNDITSIPGRRLTALLAALNSTESKTKAALDLLRGWDGVERGEAAQAALAEVWIARHLGKAFLEAVLPKSAADAIAAPDIAAMLDALERPETRFVADRDATAPQMRDRLMLATLKAAYIEMEKLQGADAKGWQWGRLHYALPTHLLGDRLADKLRDKLQPGPFPKSGGPFTPNQSTYQPSDFRLTNGPSFRVVFDVGNWDNSRAVNFPGQSGDPDDPHYRDLAQMWLGGEYFPLLYTRAAVEKATQTHIMLRPSKQ